MSIPKRIKEHCLRGNLHLACAESASVGYMQAYIAREPGASTYFQGGVTAYTLGAKVGILGVEPRHAESVNCVSADVARQMARGVCRLFDADIGVAVTGYAEPDPERGVIDPFCWIGIEIRCVPFVERCVLSPQPLSGAEWARPGSHRVLAQQDFAHAALEHLVLLLDQLDS